jgi:hypothetical protein
MSLAEIWALGAVVYFIAMSGMTLCYTVGRCDFQHNWGKLPPKFRWMVAAMFGLGLVLVSLIWFAAIPCQIFHCYRRIKRGEPIIGA